VGGLFETINRLHEMTPNQETFNWVVKSNLSMLVNTIEAEAADYAILKVAANPALSDMEVRKLAVSFFHAKLAERITEKLTREL
jgi:hypothetical protein